MLKIEGLSIGYRRRRSETVIADGLDLELHRGELVCLLGPNGAGKSTLMRTMAGMQEPLRGRVRIDGSDVHQLSARQRAKHLAVVLTEKEHAGLMTVYSHVALGRYPHTGWSGRLAPHDHTVVRAALEQVGAEPFANRYVADLSDGERQRVMMARALAQEPRAMLLDEITAFLDLPRRVEILRLLRDLARETGRAILISTHDLDLAIRTADQIWLMPKGGPLRAGAPEDLVLAGAFADTFASEGVSFDDARGEFRVQHNVVGRVELVGEGLGRTWVARALEREAVHIWDGGGTHPGMRISVRFQRRIDGLSNRMETQSNALQSTTW